MDNTQNDRIHLLEMVLPFLGMFAPYKISIIPAPAIILTLVLVFQRRGVIVKPEFEEIRPFVYFFFYIVVRDLVHMMFSISDPVSVQLNRLLELVVMYVLMFLACDDFDEDILFKWWKIAGCVFGIGMIYHVVLLFLGRSIYPISIIPGYSIASELSTSFTRPTSFFSEPAAYVTSMMPLLFLSLKKADFKWAVISTFLIVISTSTVGVALTAVLWATFILLDRRPLRSKIKYLLFVAIFVFMFFNLSIFADTLQKVEDVSTGGSTFWSRISGPFQMVRAMNWYELPFGTAVLDTRTFVFDRISEFPSTSNVVTTVRNGSSVFLNTVAYLIYRYGVVGLVLFFGIFRNKIFNENYGARLYAIMLIVAAFAQGSIAEPNLCLIILLLYSRKSNSKIEDYNVRTI